MANSWNPLPGVRGSIQMGQPERAAVLLFHGLRQTGISTWKTPSTIGWNFDYQHDLPQKDLGEHDGPGVGISEFGLSDLLEVDSLNWFDFLVNQGFTVAEWDQPPPDFATALPSALAASDMF